jgi:hypothetical protein
MFKNLLKASINNNLFILLNKVFYNYISYKSSLFNIKELIYYYKLSFKMIVLIINILDL